MRKVLFILLGLVWGGSLSSFAQNNKSIDKIVAIVGKNIVLQSEIDQQYIQYLYSGQPENEKVKCDILQQMLTQKLLKQQADIDSVTVDDAQVTAAVDNKMRGMINKANGDEAAIENFLGISIPQYKDQIKPGFKEMLTADEMRRKITEKAGITPQEVKIYYNSILKDSLKKYNTEVEIGNIELYPKLSREEKQIYRDKIEALRLRVKSGESFATLAKLYSEDPGSAANGGEYGYIGDKEFAKEYTSWAFKLKKGEISPVFETEFGYHFIEVLDRRSALVKTRHILIVPKPTALSNTRLAAKADSLYKKLVDKKTTFSVAASQYSDNNETKYNGGMMTLMYGNGIPSTYIPMDKLDANIFPIIDTLKVGEISKPMEFTDPQGKKGLRMFYLKNRVGPHIANLAQDYPKIKQEALEHKMNDVIVKWFDDKRKQTYIKIEPEFQTCDELKQWLTVK